MLSVSLNHSHCGHVRLCPPVSARTAVLPTATTVLPIADTATSTLPNAPHHHPPQCCCQRQPNRHQSPSSNTPHPRTRRSSPWTVPRHPPPVCRHLPSSSRLSPTTKQLAVTSNFPTGTHHRHAIAHHFPADPHHAPAGRPSSPSVLASPTTILRSHSSVRTSFSSRMLSFTYPSRYSTSGCCRRLCPPPGRVCHPRRHRQLNRVATGWLRHPHDAVGRYVTVESHIFAYCFGFVCLDMKVSSVTICMLAGGEIEMRQFQARMATAFIMCVSFVCSSAYAESLVELKTLIGALHLPVPTGQWTGSLE